MPAVAEAKSRKVAGNRARTPPNTEAAETSHRAPPTEQFAQIRLDRIEPSKTNPRKTFRDLDELAASITANGVIEPLIVRPIRSELANNKAQQDVVEALGLDPDRRYELVCGERRLRAAKLAKLATVPCIIRNYSPVQAVQVQLRENHDRDDVHPLEELSGFEHLLRLGESVATIEAATGYARKYIHHRLQLKNLAPAGRELFAENKIGAGHAQLLARLPEPAQERAVGWLEEQINRDYSPRTPSAADLQEFISNDTLRELSAAKWALDDASLLPAAGACAECMKNTANQSELFDDVPRNSPQCMDAGCFLRKTDAFVQLQISKAKERAGGETPVLLAESTYDKSLVKRFGGKVESKWSAGIVDEPRAKAEKTEKAVKGVKLAVIVDGDDAGKVVRIKTTKSGTSAAAAQAERSRREQQKKVEAARAETALNRRIVMTAARRTLDEHSGPDGITVTNEMLRVIAPSVWDRLDGDSRKFLAKERGWKRKSLSDYGFEDREAARLSTQGPIPQLIEFVIQCLLISSTKADFYGARKERQDRMKAVAAAWNIDVKSLAASADEEPSEDSGRKERAA